MSDQTPKKPNPRRVAAGKRNRALRGKITEEGRARLAASAKLNRAWEHSTGPRTAEGKARSSRNARRSDEARLKDDGFVLELLGLISMMAETRRMSKE